MLCQNVRKASIGPFHTSNQRRKNQFQLCKKCAEEKGELIYDQGNGGFSFQRFISGYVPIEQANRTKADSSQASFNVTNVV